MEVRSYRKICQDAEAAVKQMGFDFGLLGSGLNGCWLRRIWRVEQ